MQKLRQLPVSIWLLLFAAVPAFAAFDKGPYLQTVTQNSITVCFEGGSFDFLTGSMEYGPDQSFGQTAQGSGSKQRHEITITGLNPNTRYYYRVRFGNETSQTYSFVTAPRPDEPFSFLAFGDDRTNHNDHRAVVDAVMAFSPRMVLNSGDLIDYGFLADNWQTFFDIERELMATATLYPAFGNHEIGGDPFWNQLFVLGDQPQVTEKYYSFKYGNMAVVVFDSNTLPLDPLQKSWLESALRKFSTDAEVQHLVVQCHHPIYSTSKWGSNIPVQNIVQPWFEQYGVQLVLSGHDHLYQHSVVNNIHYIVSGGGGAPLYNYTTGPDWLKVSEKVLHYCVAEVDGPMMTLTSYRLDGSVIDSFTVESAPPTPVPTTTPTPGNNDTPTPLPTDTPDAPTATPTLTPAPPRILMGGYWTSGVTTSGGTMQLVAVITDPVNSVPVMYQGIEMGFELWDDGNSGDLGAGDFFYGFQTGLGSFPAPGHFLLEVGALHQGLQSTWPYLQIR